MNRIYLDYNATSPLAPAVTRWLAKGDLLWANPASQHSSGKKSAHSLDDVRQKLHALFQLTSLSHGLVFHSGATEAVNSAVTGWWLSEVQKNVKPLFVYSPLDHACVRAQAARLKALGHETVELKVDRQGDLLFEESIAVIADAQSRVNGSTLLNFTWVNNETGVVWPLSLAEELKARTGARVHVDAAQAIGKVANCWQLSDKLDYYSFSSHKCGGFKGHGWSFIKADWPGEALILGGGQQKGARAGTENVIGAYALWLALDELKTQWKPAEQAKIIQELRAVFDVVLQGRGERVARGAKELNLNTVLFVSNALPSDMALPMFDLAGLEVSAGAACSSGAAKPSHVLEALGFGERTRNGLRLSISWVTGANEWSELRPRLMQVLEKLPLRTP